MRAKPFIYSVLGATLISAGMMSAHAATGVYYDPSNTASPSGKTVGYELKLTIGCPGKGLLDAPCPAPVAPADSDRDGVIDPNDKCPNTPAGRKVNAQGCELDSDGDGVVDGDDKCPNTPAGRKVNAQGCELDSDGDGVVDGEDRCPNTPAGRKVNRDGCELDSDGDGVVDGNDKCPNTPRGRKVDAQGCEFDTDGDGLVDGADRCPKRFAKTPDGCPPPLVLEGVNFDNDKATLRPESFPVLDKTIVGLKDWGEVKIEVSGHTDSKAKDEYNMNLSQRRAETVRDYLISKGIAAERLTAKGYGETMPIADNETAEGRFKNRRVELKQID